MEDGPLHPVNLDVMYKHCQHLVKAGCHGLVYMGTNSEMAMVNHEERSNIIKTAKQAVRDPGIGDYPLVVGISPRSVSEAVPYAKEAADAGAGWGLILPPSYWAKAVTPNVVINYYRGVADLSPIPIVIYNYPSVVTGVDLDFEQISAFATHPNIVAAKLTCDQLGKAIRVTTQYGPEHMTVYGGSAVYLIAGLGSGSNGCVVVDNTRKHPSFKERYHLPNRSASESFCKKHLNNTKYGAWWDIGRELGLDNKNIFVMRRPYPVLSETAKNTALETFKILEETERSLSGREGIA